MTKVVAAGTLGLLILTACGPPHSPLARFPLGEKLVAAEITPSGLRLIVPALPPELAAQVPAGTRASFYVVDVGPTADRVVAYGTCRDMPVGLGSAANGSVNVVCIDGATQRLRLGSAKPGTAVVFHDVQVPRREHEIIELDRFEGRDAYGPRVVIDVLREGPKDYEVADAATLSFGPAGVLDQTAVPGPRETSYYSWKSVPSSLRLDDGGYLLSVWNTPQEDAYFRLPSPVEGHARWARVSCMRTRCVFAAELTGRVLRVYRFDRPER